MKADTDRYNVVLFDHKTGLILAILTSDLTGIHITAPGIHDILIVFLLFPESVYCR